MIKKKPFHNIQPREEHSPGGRCVTVKNYNQEKTIESRYRGFTTRCKQGQICQTTSKKARPLLEKHSLGGWTSDQPVPEWQEGKGMEKAWNSSWSKAYNIICETWWSSVMAWACMASSGTGLLVFGDYTALHSTNGRWPKTYSKSNPGVFEDKKSRTFCNGQVNFLISSRLSMHVTCWRQNWMQKDPQTNNN